MARERGKSWLGRFEHRLLAVFGPAQVSRLDGQPRRSEHRMSGVGGDWVVRRDANGVTYVESARREDDAGR